MNRHMNLFRFYGENISDEKLENNLTKGLALCLKYDHLLLHTFISEIDAEFNIQSIPPQEQAFFNIDIQVQANSLEGERVIAVSITLDDYTEEQYKATKARKTDSPVIDLVISYADTVVICEIKPSDENCLAQLKNQVDSYSRQIDESFCSLSWKKITAIFEKINNLSQSMGTINNISSDYLAMLKGHFPSWHEIPKLNELSVQTQNLKHNIDQRLLLACQSGVGMELADFKSRVNFQLNWQIASELKIETSIPEKLTNISDVHINFVFWAGDTKRQGYSLFRKDYVQQLLMKTNLTTVTESYLIAFEPYFKFSSFQRGVAWVGIKQQYYKLFNQKLFREIAGRQKREHWHKVDKCITLFDAHWKEKSKWTERIENSNRTQIDISMGVRVKLSVPLTGLLIADKEDNGLEKKLSEIIQMLNSEFGS